MDTSNSLKNNSFRNEYGYVVATLAGLGQKTKAPGTVASMAVMPVIYGVWLVLLLYYNLNSLTALIVSISLASVVYVLGSLATYIYMENQVIPKDDPQEVVVDEVAGMFVTSYILLWLEPMMPLWCAVFAVFILFRLFDILKPWPIDWLEEHVEGCAGVMIDDVLAAFMAIITCAVLLTLSGL